MLIILDRDGVINEDSPDYIKLPQEWIALPGSLAAIARLNCAGYQVVIATNQSGVGRGYYSLEMLDAIHDKMRMELATVGGRIDAIYYCPHLPTADCDCRKPKPGMLLQIAEDFSVDLSSTYYIGDSFRDIQAAQQAGALPILVCTGNGEKTKTTHASVLIDVPIYRDLNDVVSTLII